MGSLLEAMYKVKDGILILILILIFKRAWKIVQKTHDRKTKTVWSVIKNQIQTLLLYSDVAIDQMVKKDRFELHIWVINKIKKRKRKKREKRHANAK